MQRDNGTISKSNKNRKKMGKKRQKLVILFDDDPSDDAGVN